MIYAIIDNNENIFDTWEDYYRATFSPEIAEKVTFITDFTVRGKDYKARKAAAREIAIDISLNQCGGLSWYESTLLTDKLETLGKRYGLLEELRENCMI